MFNFVQGQGSWAQSLPAIGFASGEAGGVKRSNLIDYEIATPCGLAMTMQNNLVRLYQLRGDNESKKGCIKRPGCPFELRWC